MGFTEDIQIFDEPIRIQNPLSILNSNVSRICDWGYRLVNKRILWNEQYPVDRRYLGRFITWRLRNIGDRFRLSEGKTDLQYPSRGSACIFEIANIQEVHGGFWDVKLRHIRTSYHPSTLGVLRHGSLVNDGPNSEEQNSSLNETNDDEPCCEISEFPLYLYVFVSLAFVGLITWGLFLIDDHRYASAGILILLGCCGVLSIGTTALFCDPLFWRAEWLGLSRHGDPYRCKHKHKDRTSSPQHGIIVSQKDLTTCTSCNTVTGMSNVLSKDKQIVVIGALAEGSSIRSIERITGVHRDTVMRLGVRVGQGCAVLLDAKMRDLPCRYLQFDEVWGFIGKKERHLRIDDDPQYGDVWTFCAIDAETKLVPTFKVGKRDLATAKAFVSDLHGRLANRVQISSDALKAYVDAIEQTFGADVDFGQIVKTYEHDYSQHPEYKYSAPTFVAVDKRAVTGSPDMDLVSTSYIERLNATTRLHMRRLTRLTLAFSKKLENFQAAVALHFAYYNLVKRHGTLRCTPAMAAGIERDFWTVENLIEATA